MITFLRSLEPRLFNPGDYIFEEGESVDEQIFVISRDLRKPNYTGVYVVGFTCKTNQFKDNRYFHVKLGPKSVICGYENLYGKLAEFTYKATMHMDAFGLRKTSLKDIFEEDADFKKQMSHYSLEFYHEIVRKPMLAYKKRVLSEITEG